MNQEPILAIDIGADSIKIAEFSYPAPETIMLDNFAYTEYGGDMSDDQLLESLYQNFRATMEKNNFTAHKVHLCISGQLSFVKFVKLPPVSDPSKLKSIVEFEAKQNLPFPMEEVVWDYQLINSEGAEMEAMFVVIKKDIIQRITDIIELSGHQTVLVDCSATAGYNAARLNGVGLEECSMLLNIGGRCSTLMFIDKGNYFVRTIPIAGHYITEQIAKEFNMSYSDAEDMKRRFGFVSLGGAYEEPESEVAATVSKIVRNAMTRLHGEINRSVNVYRAQQGGNRPERMYLAGGSSVMAYTPRFFEEKMRISVEYLNPFQVITINSQIDKTALSDVAHLFSDVIGAGMRGATVCPIEINLLPESLRKAYDLRARKPYFIAAGITLFLAMGLAALGTYIQAKNMEKNPKIYADSIKKVESVKTQMEECAKTLKDQQKQLDLLLSREAYHTGWIRVLNELQTLLPDNAWISNLSFEDADNLSELDDVSDPGMHKMIRAKIYIHCRKYDADGNAAANTLSKWISKTPNSVFSEIKIQNQKFFARIEGKKGTTYNNVASIEALFYFKTPKKESTAEGL